MAQYRIEHEVVHNLILLIPRFLISTIQHDKHCLRLTKNLGNKIGIRQWQVH